MSSLNLTKEEIDLLLGEFNCDLSSEIIFGSETFLKKSNYEIERIVEAKTFWVVFKGKSIKDEEVAIKLISNCDKEEIEKEFK